MCDGEMVKERMNEKDQENGPAENGEAPTKLGAGRRAGKVVLLIIVWLLMLETTGIICCKGFRGVGHWGAQQERNALLQKLPSLADLEDGADTVVVYNNIPREVHPYFGFTLQRDDKYVNNAGFPGEDDYPYRSGTNEFVVGIFGGSVAIGQAIRFQGRSRKCLFGRSKSVSCSFDLGMNGPKVTIWSQMFALAGRGLRR
jgi:hypothetical protein